MKMELIEGSETSAVSTVTLGNYPKENILHIEHGESLKSRRVMFVFKCPCLHLQGATFSFSSVIRDKLNGTYMSCLAIEV